MSVAKFSFLLSGGVRLPAAAQVAATRNFWTTAAAGEPARSSDSTQLPERPKKPLSSYFQFMKQNGKSLSGTLTVAEKAKEMGRQWREMDEEARRPFVALAEAEQLEYHKNMDKLMAKLEKSGKLELFHAKEDVARSEATIRRLKKKISKLEAEMDIPKSVPKNAWNLFIAEEMKVGEMQLHGDWPNTFCIPERVDLPFVPRYINIPYKDAA